MPSEETHEPTFAESIAEANAAERTRSDDDAPQNDDAREMSDGSTFADVIADYNADQKSTAGLKVKPPTEPADEFPLPAPTEREQFLEALRAASGDNGRSNESEFAKAEKAAAGESFLDRLSAAELTSFLKSYDLDESALQNPDVRRVLERQLAFSQEAEEPESEDGVEEDAPEESEEEQLKEEKPTEPAEPIELPPTMQELTLPGNEEKLKAFNENTRATWERSQQTTQPIMLDLMTTSLAQTLETPEEHIPALRGVVETLNYGAQSFVQSAVPPMVEQGMQQAVQTVAEHFGELLEQVCPGLRDSFVEATAANTWQSVCESDEFKGLKLPSFGSPEFHEAAEKIYAENPWLNDFDPPGPDGKPLPMREALRVKAEVAARLLAGERVSPKAVLAQVTAAMETAKRGEQSRQRRVTASRSLGAGRSKGQLAPKADTSFADDIRSYMAAQKSGGRG